MPTYRERIATKLGVLTPSKLEIVDDSARHHGHGGAHPDGETHFTVTMEAAAFAGKSRIDRQRMVYGLLADEMNERVHALALVLTAPGEGKK
jgi:BolA family transcriptional regulator, general stress-responsive regulator